MKRRRDSSRLWVGLLFGLACLAGMMLYSAQVTHDQPRALFSDAKPLGGKGLRRLLEKLGYSVNRQSARLDEMPSDAKIWLLLDPETRISRGEADLLLAWVKKGGTLLFATHDATSNWGSAEPPSAGIARLREVLGVGNLNGSATFVTNSQPPLSTLNLDAASNYRAGVSSAQGSAATFGMNRPFLEVAGDSGGTQIARVDWGSGQVFIVPDALLFTNYALSRPQNAVLVTNFVRAHQTGGAVYFDERQHGEIAAASSVERGLLYYLWRPPLRYAWIQLFLAGLCLWILAGRRFGAPVPLPEGGPVTRASQFAAAMGALFLKANRPQAVGLIVGTEFRKKLARRLGMSPADPDLELAKRTHELSGVPLEVVDRLLLASKAPADNDAQVLRDAQDMELVLKRLDNR